MASHTAQVVYSTVPQNHHAHHLNAVASSSSVSQQERLPSIRELPSIRDLNFPFEGPGTQQVNPIPSSSAISSAGRQQRQQQQQQQQQTQPQHALQQQQQYYLQQPQVHPQQPPGYVQQQPMQQYVQMDPTQPTSSPSVSRARPQSATWTPPPTHPPGPAPSVNANGQPTPMSLPPVPSADYHHHHSSSIANNISLHHPQHLQSQHSHQTQSPLKRQKPGSSAVASGAGIGGGIGMSAATGTQGAVVSGRTSHPGYAPPPSSHGYTSSLPHASSPSPYSSIPISSLAVSGTSQAPPAISSPLPPSAANNPVQPETYDYIPYQQTHPHQSHQQPPQPQQSQSHSAVPQTTAASAHYAPGRSTSIPQSAMYSATTTIASSTPATAEAWHAQQSHHSQHTPTPPQQTLPLQPSQVVSHSTISSSPANHYAHTSPLQHAHVVHQQHQQQPVQAGYSQTQTSPFSRTAPLIAGTIDPSSATAGQVSASARSSMGSVTSLVASPGPPIAVMPNSSANTSSYATSGASGGSAANVGGSTLLPVGKHEVMEADSSMEESWISKIQSHCMALYTLAERYVQLQHSSPQSQPSLTEVADMTEHALVVVSLLEELKRLSISGEPVMASIKMEDVRSSAVGYPSGENRAPKRPWEDVSGEDDFVDAKSYAGASDRVQTAAEKDMALIRSKRATNSTALNAGQPKGKYRKRSRATPPGKCHSCNIRETPEWRRGPDGARTLCNACGLHYAKLVRKRDKMGPDVKIDLEMLRASTRAATEKENAAAAATALASAQVAAQQQVQKGGSTGIDHLQLSVHSGPPPTSAAPSTGMSGGSIGIDKEGTGQDSSSLLQTQTQSQSGQSLPPPPSSSAPPGSANNYAYATIGSSEPQPPRQQTMVPSPSSHSPWGTGSAQPARAYMHEQQQSFLRSSHVPPSRSTST